LRIVSHPSLDNAPCDLEPLGNAEWKVIDLSHPDQNTRARKRRRDLFPTSPPATAALSALSLGDMMACSFHLLQKLRT
jgi:hypothetical protein